MAIIMYGQTAYQYWTNASSDAQPQHVPLRMLQDLHTTNADVEKLARIAPHLATPYHALALSVARKHKLDSAIFHTCSQALPRNSFVELADGIYAPCPELCFMQIAREVDILRLIRIGYRLCGRFRIQSGGVLESRQPLTMPDAIKRYLVEAGPAHGSVQATRAVEHILANAASPAEIALAMRLTLPHRLGGFGLPHPVLNQTIELTESAAQLTRKQWHEVDLFWEEGRLAIEYDSDQVHLDSGAHTDDAIKRLALGEMDLQVISVTRSQLKSPELLSKVAHQAAKRLGVRQRPRGKNFTAMQEALFHLR